MLSPGAACGAFSRPLSARNLVSVRGARESRARARGGVGYRARRRAFIRELRRFIPGDRPSTGRHVTYFPTHMTAYRTADAQQEGREIGLRGSRFVLPA